LPDDDRDESDGPLFLVVTIKPRPDRRQEAEAQLQSMRQNTLNEPGCVFMHLRQPQDDSDTWVMLEMFRSRAAWDEHMRQPYNIEGNKILEDLAPRLAESDRRLLISGDPQEALRVEPLLASGAAEHAEFVATFEHYRRVLAEHGAKEVLKLYWTPQMADVFAKPAVQLGH
jgi:quinol monooxygenase YgiN